MFLLWLFDCGVCLRVWFCGLVLLLRLILGWRLGIVAFGFCGVLWCCGFRACCSSVCGLCLRLVTDLLDFWGIGWFGGGVMLFISVVLFVCWWCILFGLHIGGCWRS